MVDFSKESQVEIPAVSQAVTTVSSFTPTIAWPTSDGSLLPVDLPHFPNRENRQARLPLGEFGLHSNAFALAIRQAVKRVWIMDPYLFAQETIGTSTFYSLFVHDIAESDATDFRMIASEKNGALDQIGLLERIERQFGSPQTSSQLDLEVRFDKLARSHPDQFHDRFAIIDDELWHWGANVGGTHHHVNAYTRGWSAVKTGAVSYFEDLWAAVGGKK